MLFSQHTYQGPSPTRDSAAESETSRSTFEQATRPKCHACEPCRRMKIQCVYSPPESNTCERCSKANRRCVPQTFRPRARASKSVAALEKKIRTLARDLEQIKATNPSESFSEQRPEVTEPDKASPDATIADSSQSSHGQQGIVQSNLSPSTNRGSSMSQSPSVASGWGTSFQFGGLEPAMTHAGFDHFTQNFLPHFPVLVISQSSTAAKVQKEQPILFLAILNAASGIYPVDMQSRINQELFSTIARLVLIEGIKSLEVVQALLVAALWYYTPPRYQNLKYYQLVSWRVSRVSYAEGSARSTARVSWLLISV